MSDSSQSLPIDIVWISISTYLVMFMQTGFSFLEAGGIRFKNLQNILMKNLLDVLFGTIFWWLLGYAFAFSGDHSGFIGGNDLYAGTNFQTSEYYNFMFQWAFCCTAATIVSGGVAERIRLSTYTFYSIFITSWVYPVIVHWCWSEQGWLKDMGFRDFAGSGVVHLTGGTAALVGAILLGSRAGRFDSTNQQDFIPNNLGYTVLGTFILWMGWYGFNCGSTLTADIEKIGHIGMNTTIAAISSGFFVYLLHYFTNRNTNNKYSISALCNGILAGLVSVTAGCNNFETYCAFIVGIIGGLCYFGFSKFCLKIKVDDPLEASAIHGCCGALGLIAVAFFDQDDGIFYGHDGKILGIQLLGCLCIFAWSLGWTFIFLMIFKSMKKLRIEHLEELVGADIAKHGQYGIILEFDKLKGIEKIENPERLAQKMKTIDLVRRQTIKVFSSGIKTEKNKECQKNEVYEMVPLETEKK